MHRIVASLFVFCALSLGAVRAWGMVTVDTVFVGDAGNAPDSGRWGDVSYNYRIGTFEVTLAQYSDFLNAVAKTDSFGLYSEVMATNLNVAGIARNGLPGSYSYSVIGSPNKPIVFVSWGDAVRFCNWLHNGQPSGQQDFSTTEDGAYTLNGATTRDLLSQVTRNANAIWFLPSENEWYKAAYYEPAARGGDYDDYWAYATRTNVTPYSDQPPGTSAPHPSNTANFRRTDGISNGYNDGYAVTGSNADSDNQNYLTEVGAYTFSRSPYGTFDQSGNVGEWVEDQPNAGFRRLRGGGWTSDEFGLISSSRPGSNPTQSSISVGFRMATVPEPTASTSAVIACIICLANGIRRHRS